MPASQLNFNHLQYLEAEAIHILREVAAQFERPAILYSIGKDSSCVVRLAQKAFYPGKIPFPLVHIDTGFDFPEMYEFRDDFVKEIGANLLVFRNEEEKRKDANPYDLGTQRCCGVLRTRALVDALNEGKLELARAAQPELRGASRERT